MSVRFCPIASGSSGNCIYVGTPNTHLLIDAGLSGRTVEQGLAGLSERVAEQGITGLKGRVVEQGITGLKGRVVEQNLSRSFMHTFSGILVTHEHSDHVTGVGVLARRYHVPVYATPKTWRYLLRHNTVGKIPENQCFIVEPGVPVTIGDIEVTPFDIPHDASQPVGYNLRIGGVKVTVATDMGCVTDTIREAIKHSHILLLESNHDLEMLSNGRYPRPLKERVMGPRGHLSNVAAGRLLCEAAWEGLRHVFLGHLSEENNRPMIAMDTVQRILDGNSVSIKHLTVAERYGPGELVEVEAMETARGTQRETERETQRETERETERKMIDV